MSSMQIIFWMIMMKEMGTFSTSPGLATSLPLTAFTSNGGFHAHCLDPRKSSGTSWCSAQCCNNPDTYIQVNFDQIHQITAVGSLGRANYAQWVKSYKLQYSEDGNTFVETGITNPLSGNTNQNTEVLHNLNIRAKSLRFTPVTWHGWKSMRIEAYGTTTGQGQGQGQANVQQAQAPAVQLAQTAFTSNGGFHNDCPDARKLSFSSWCVGNGGNENAQVYLQVNLGKMYLVKKIGTLGRKNHGQWVKSYNLQYSEDCNRFVGDGIANPLSGNNDQNTEVFHTVNKYAKCLRVIPVQYHGWKSMRLEVYGYWEM